MLAKRYPSTALVKHTQRNRLLLRCNFIFQMPCVFFFFWLIVFFATIEFVDLVLFETCPFHPLQVSDLFEWKILWLHLVSSNLRDKRRFTLLNIIIIDHKLLRPTKLMLRIIFLLLRLTLIFNSCTSILRPLLSDLNRQRGLWLLVVALYDWNRV